MENFMEQNDERVQKTPRELLREKLLQYYPDRRVETDDDLFDLLCEYDSQISSCYDRLKDGQLKLAYLFNENPRVGAFISDVVSGDDALLACVRHFGRELLESRDDFDTLEWIDDAVNLFDKYPNMVILGGCGGYRVQFDKVNEIVSVHLDGQGTNFKFVPTVDRAPMWVNRQLFLQKLHHIDYSFAPFMCDDHELCLRAWLNGLSVGWYKCPFKSLSAGGMRIWNNSLAGELAQKNYRKLYQMYAAKETEINSLVEDANREILEEKSI